MGPRGLRFATQLCYTFAMASLYRRARSPFWQLRTRIEGVWRCENTGLRHDNAADTKKAKILVAERSYLETQSKPLKLSDGWMWVPKWLRATATGKTLECYELRWRHLTRFLALRKIGHPQALRHEHGQDYLEWRMEHARPRSGKPISRNTAIAEIKLLKTIMSQAVAREMADKNTLDGLKLRKEDPAEKPEITIEEQRRIEAALVNEPLWMQRSWAIAMATGCRLRETRLAPRQINMAMGTIDFSSPKGGRKKAYAIPMPAVIKPLCAEIVRSKKPAFEFPFQPSRQWGLFFERLDLEHLCFHCSRVTFITRLAREGAPLAVAMRLVNHASTAIHRIYQRVRLDDLGGWADRVSPPAPCATEENLPAKSTARPSGSRASSPKSARSRS
jgi:integrase